MTTTTIICKFGLEETLDYNFGRDITINIVNMANLPLITLRSINKTSRDRNPIDTIILSHYKFNQILGKYTLDNRLNVKRIIVESYFPINISLLKALFKRLTSSLTHLEFQKFNLFNQVIDVGVLPTSLKYLKLGDNYNQVIDLDVLPFGIKELIVSKKYNASNLDFLSKTVIIIKL